MSKLASDGLSRLQNNSHIAANTWRQWCNLLKLDPQDVIDVWEEICYPIVLATRQMPDVPYILQMRAIRVGIDIDAFRTEVPKILHCIHFIQSLHDSRLSGGKFKNALLKFYRRVCMGGTPYTTRGIDERFIIDLCASILVAKVLPVAKISLVGVIKPFIEGRNDIDQILKLGVKALGDQPYAARVRQCLAERAAYLEGIDEDADDLPEEEDGDWGDEETRAEEEEEEEEEFEEDEDEDEDEDGDDDYEEDGGAIIEEAIGSIDAFLVHFKASLHRMYEHEADAAFEAYEGEDEAIEKAEDLLDRRLKAIASFKPMQSAVPTVSEAQAVARRAEAARNPVIHKSSGGGGSRGGSVSSAPLKGDDRRAMLVRSAVDSPKHSVPAGLPSLPSLTPSVEGEGFIETGYQRDHIDVASVDMVDLEEIALSEVGSKAKEIGKLLASIEPLDQHIWAVLVDPTSAVGDLRTMARMVGTEGTGANKAYNNVKQVACYLKIKHMLHAPAGGVQRERNFMVEVRAFMNAMGHSRPLDANSRQLMPLVHVLDHAGAALLRLEALRVNFNFAQDHPDEYTHESVTTYYEEALRALTDQVEHQLRGQAREKADADTVAMLEAFRAARFADGLVKQSCDYMARLSAAGRVGSVADFQLACSEEPLEFADVSEVGKLGDVPPEELVAQGIGEVFDAACSYAVSEAWKVMQDVHRPASVAARIRAGLREILVGVLAVTPEAKRHQEKPTIALKVTSLEKLTGNSSLKDFFVRVDDGGQVAYIQGFESGDYADLFELREYKPMRLHAATQKHKEESGTEQLQTGRKYLFTVGRTRKLFCDSPGALVNGCIRAEGGGPKVFPVF